jgi:hypothetical protein
MTPCSAYVHDARKVPRQAFAFVCAPSVCQAGTQNRGACKNVAIESDEAKTETPVAAPRIGDGQGSIIIGLICLGVMAFAMLAAVGGAEGAAGFAGVVGVIAVTLFATGFLKRMFHMIERRLIDIQADHRRRLSG